MSSRFFQNTACEHYPCHAVGEAARFNCLFCYYPLYPFAGCGGAYKRLRNGVKDCSDCVKPHLDYDGVLDGLRRHYSPSDAPAPERELRL